MPEDFALQPEADRLTAHRPTLAALTGIRFFAAVYVVVFHTRVGQMLSDSGHRLAGNFFMNGYLAVPLFFLLSGVILAYTYEGQIARRGDARRFWEARFARIWPVYMVSMLLTTAVTFEAPRAGQMLAAALMVQAWNPFDPGLAGVWNGVCWTLSVEAFFYVLFPWVQVQVQKLSDRALLSSLGAVAALAVATNSSSRTLGYTAYGAFRYIPFPLAHLPEFLVGVGLGNCFLRQLAQLRAQQRRDDASLLPGRGAWTYGFALLSFALLCRGQSGWTSLVVPVFSALIYGLAAEATWLSRWLSTPLLLLGGGISYSIYLLQMPVKFGVGMLAERAHLGSVAVRLGMTLGVLLAVSLIMFKGVENPARKVLRRFFAGWERRRDELKSLHGERA